MLAGHLEETAPKGVTELTVQMGLSPILVTAADSVPGGIFRSLSPFSEGSPSPPLSFCPLFSSRKLPGEADRAAVKTTSVSRFTGGRNPSAGREETHTRHGHRVHQGSLCDLRLSLSGPRSAKCRQDCHLPGRLWEEKRPLCGPVWRLAPGQGTSLFSQ